MRHANARDLLRRRQVLALLGLTLLGTAPLSALAAEQGEGEGAAAKGGEKPEKKRKKQGEGEPIPEPPINSPQLIVEAVTARSEEHTSELQSLMRISYAVFCLKKKRNNHENRDR